MTPGCPGRFPSGFGLRSQSFQWFHSVTNTEILMIMNLLQHLILFNYLIKHQKELCWIVFPTCRTKLITRNLLRFHQQFYIFRNQCSSRSCCWISHALVFKTRKNSLQIQKWAKMQTEGSYLTLGDIKNSLSCKNTFQFPNDTYEHTQEVGWITCSKERKQQENYSESFKNQTRSKLFLQLL